ncbi:MAG: IS91 family transposase [Phycisphaerae bacterium]
MLEVADILRRYGDGYLEAYGQRMLPSHLRAFRDILRCRTPDMGGHVFACDHCDHQVFAYHSCRNRSCPKCHTRHTDAWVEARRKELLPVPYFHVVFTVPDQWRPVIRQHQEPLYGILMKAAARSLIKLAADPHYVGGLVGILAVLHTWTRTMVFHPHVHCLVPAGGVSDGELPGDRRWIPARTNYLVPVKALSRVFRGMFVDMVKKAMPELAIPSVKPKQEWVVYAKPTVQGANAVLNYLGRYVHRIAISNSRIVSINDGRVVFKYQKSGGTSWKTMSLTANEFIRRFMQHVLPMGVHKVRYYGLWAPGNRPLLRRVQIALTAPICDKSARESKSEPKPADQSDQSSVPALKQTTCPRCQHGTLVYVGPVARRPRAPPPSSAFTHA